MTTPILYIFGGLPGTGKSTLAGALARRMGAVYIRIDTIEQAIRGSGLSVSGGEGYEVAYEVAFDNLCLGLSIVADSINPIRITRESWTNVARRAGADFVEIEVVCSEKAEHKRRVESRETDIEGLVLPTWQQLLDREYEVWASDHIVMDTAARTVDESISELFRNAGILPETVAGRIREE